MGDWVGDSDGLGETEGDTLGDDVVSLGVGVTLGEGVTVGEGVGVVSAGLSLAHMLAILAELSVTMLSTAFLPMRPP